MRGVPTQFPPGTVQVTAKDLIGVYGVTCQQSTCEPAGINACIDERLVAFIFIIHLPFINTGVCRSEN